MTINLAQSILRQQFPSALGLEHTELGLRNMFAVRKCSFLQILYGNYHWATVFGRKVKLVFTTLLVMEVFLKYFCTKYATLPNLPLTKYLLRYSRYNKNRIRLIEESFLLLFQLPMHLVTIHLVTIQSCFPFITEYGKNLLNFKHLFKWNLGECKAPCCIYQDWYHKKCMNIPLKIFRSDTVEEVWKCKSCQRKYLWFSNSIHIIFSYGCGM